MRRLSGDERIASGTDERVAKVLQFWQWSASDLLSNATRGVFAEFLVGMALDCLPAVRDEWGAFDLKTRSGITVEVKSSAYLQAWPQRRLSKLSFGIAPTRAWDVATGEFEGEVRRQAQVYVFCVLGHMDRATVDPLELRQWHFHVLARQRLDSLGGQKQIGLPALVRLQPVQTDWVGLAGAVEQCGKPGRADGN